ncbi:sortase-associated OmpA-like protein PdsO [Shewanella gelidii]|uniref:Membrane protein n=1 Tax=Shewanella gelidii TaxID=1642821 RepID=A0A917NAV8_9GAMM|nr:sortase-associated OmpA-like protein PdsO [Shewanella gelidii]MCL1098302.1 sortase-associated OmpA-like protein PdsO [Shewanella gelidii]GGI84207.1 membrane protein [Shewanella gelidii]
MKKQIIALCVIGAMTLSTQTLASEASTAASQNMPQHDQTAEAIGFGSGLVIGAVVGGPVGAFVGAIAGGVIGESSSNEDIIDAQQAQIEQQYQQLTALENQQQSLQNLSEQYANAQRELKSLKSMKQDKLTALALGLNVQFKTGSAEIEPHFKQQLDKVALMMSLSPALTLDLTGYADRRGDSDFNLVLSNQRVVEVKNYLVSQGVSENRLTDKAYGASAPLMAEQSFENDFFDRRVTLKMMSPQSEVAVNR